MTTPAEQKAAARQFAEFWRGKGYEKMTESECVAELFKRYQALVSASLKPSAPRGEAVT